MGCLSAPQGPIGRAVAPTYTAKSMRCRNKLVSHSFSDGFVVLIKSTQFVGVSHLLQLFLHISEIITFCLGILNNFLYFSILNFIISEMPNKMYFWFLTINWQEALIRCILLNMSICYYSKLCNITIPRLYNALSSVYRYYDQFTSGIEIVPNESSVSWSDYITQSIVSVMVAASLAGP